MYEDQIQIRKGQSERSDVYLQRVWQSIWMYNDFLKISLKLSVFYHLCVPLLWCIKIILVSLLWNNLSPSSFNCVWCHFIQFSPKVTVKLVINTPIVVILDTKHFNWHHSSRHRSIEFHFQLLVNRGNFTNEYFIDFQFVS